VPLKLRPSNFASVWNCATAQVVLMKKVLIEIFA
jgi:hypothetical protein